VSLLRVEQIVGLLAEEYGPIRWRPHRDPLSELVMTILSQNTSDANSRRAFDRLVARFGNWEAVAAADIEDIAEAIKLGGLAQMKAPRIKAILQRIKDERGSLDLGFLEDMPVEEAKAWLRRLPGVGPKTAACVMLFGLGRPVFPVDTHVYRVSRRLGLVDSGVSVEAAHEVLGQLFPAEHVYQSHLHLIEHGRRVCKARNPRCHKCVLLQACPAGQFLLGTALADKVRA
jgi:endonuclease-3